MLSHLIRFSIRYYGVIIALAALIVIFGIHRFMAAGLDIFPEFSPKQVIIQAESPGLSSEQVEVLVSQQIEFAIGGTIGLQTVRSESIQGLSIVTAVFPDNSDIYRNRQLINERLATLGDKLPRGVMPVMLPLSSSSATILTLGLSSGNMDLMSLRDLVDWSIVPRLLSIPGVADVNVFGGDLRQLQIQAKPAQLRRFNLSLTEVAEAVAKAAGIHGSGFIENPNQRFTVQTSGQYSTPGQFEHIAVKYADGRSITLAEVADVAYAPRPAISRAQIMAKPGVIVMVIGQYGANTLSVSRMLASALKQIKPILEKQGIQFFPHLFRPADYIETSLHNLGFHLLIGGLFVLLILYCFLANGRAALISALAIPVSLLGAVAVLLELGVNLNIMVLGGLAIALGEVVDDAIIDTENIFRRLRENQLLAQPLSTAEIISNASLEVRSSVVYASFIVALAFTPLLTLDGVAGRLFAPLGYSYILAILISLLVALTLTPALCFALFGKGKLKAEDSYVIARLKFWYVRCLAAVNKQFGLFLIIGIGLCTGGIAAFFHLEHKFLPELREGHYIVHTTGLPGTSLAESIRTGTQLTRQFMQIPGVESVSQWAGRAERGADTYGSHYSEYEVRLKQPATGAEQQRILEQLRGILDGFPGIGFEANTFLTERVDETIAGYTSPVVVNIYGNDLAELDKKAQAIARIMEELPDAANVQVRSPPGTPFLQVRLNPDRLNFWGISPEQVFFNLQAAYDSAAAGKLLQGNRVFDIAITLPPSYRSELGSVGELPLKTPEGASVRLAEVAGIQADTGRYNVLRQNFQRKQTVTASIGSGDMDNFIAGLETRIAEKVYFPVGSYAEITGAAVEQNKARHKLYLHALLAGAGILIFIFVAIGNLRHMLLTLLNLPFAFAGGIAAVLITGTPLSVGTVVGFITLFGVTVRNSIMLLSHCHYLVERENKPWNLNTLTQAAQERLPSILMTASVTALAMLPIAVNSDNAGSEIMGPMAAIIIGGLFSSTILNLLLLPCMLDRFGWPRLSP